MGVTHTTTSFLKHIHLPPFFQPALFSMYKETTHTETHKFCAQKKRKSFIQYIETLASLYIQQLVLISAMCRFTCRSLKQNLFVAALNLFLHGILALQKVMRKILPTLRMLKTDLPFLQREGFCLTVFIISHFSVSVSFSHRARAPQSTYDLDCKPNLLVKGSCVPSSKY